MKPLSFLLKTTILTVILIVGLSSLSLGANDTLLIVGGTVRDYITKRKIENANIVVPGTNVGTVTNADGKFTIKINKESHLGSLLITHLGYTNHYLTIADEDIPDAQVFLMKNAISLDPVLVHNPEPRKLVEQAVGRIERNYSDKTEMLRGFYRETILKRRNYISISEALLNIYKSPYKDGIHNDRVQIFKGRKLISQNPSDTLILKFEGGPTLSIYTDVVKNTDLFFNIESLDEYNFMMNEAIMINDRPHYVISFFPAGFANRFPLYYGRLYIDKETLTISNAEFNVSMEDRNKVTNLFVKKKPFGSRFTPEEISYYVTYRQQDGKSRLNYICNTIRFQFDLKRKLFSTNYNITSEMVVVDGETQNVAKIPRQDALKITDVFEDKVKSFTDENFWEDYNILEPTESLETGIKRLKKQQDK